MHNEKRLTFNCLNGTTPGVILQCMQFLAADLTRPKGHPLLVKERKIALS